MIAVFPGAVQSVVLLWRVIVSDVMISQYLSILGSVLWMIFWKVSSWNSVCWASFWRAQVNIKVSLKLFTLIDQFVIILIMWILVINFFSESKVVTQKVFQIKVNIIVG